MGVLTLYSVAMNELTETQLSILRMVRAFVDDEVIPVARELELTDTFPDHLVSRMRDLGLFGLTIPEEFGGSGVDTMTYALVVEELARGWMSLTGVLNSSSTTPEWNEHIDRRKRPRIGCD